MDAHEGLVAARCDQVGGLSRIRDDMEPSLQRPERASRDEGGPPWVGRRTRSRPSTRTTLRPDGWTRRLTTSRALPTRAPWFRGPPVHSHLLRCSQMTINSAGRVPGQLQTIAQWLAKLGLPEYERVLPRSPTVERSATHPVATAVPRGRPGIVISF